MADYDMDSGDLRADYEERRHEAAIARARARIAEHIATAAAKGLNVTYTPGAIEFEELWEERMDEMDFPSLVELSPEEGYDDEGFNVVVGDCEGMENTEHACYGCETPVGFVFEETEDSYGREVGGVRFRETWIDPNLRLWCEDCVYTAEERRNSNAERLAGA